MRSLFLVPLTVGIPCLGLFYLADATPPPRQQATPSTPTTADANRLLQRQPGFFVPNLGQWEHSAAFVHRSGPMTLFVENRGWVLSLVEPRSKDLADEPRTDRAVDPHEAVPSDDERNQQRRSVALRMTFEGGGNTPEIVREKKLSGHHNYFLGNDESRWRTGVPLYGAVRYENLYPGIDLRLREANGVPEYDLLLQPGADLSMLSVRVEGGRGLSIAGDGSLVIETSLGPITQPSPKTWLEDSAGEREDVVCKFTLLGGDRYGFTAPGWDGQTSLTVDPGLIWSTFLGGASVDLATAISVDESGVVTVAGFTGNTTVGPLPTTTGAYQTKYNGGVYDAFVSRLDPSKSGAAQLVYSTFLGGGNDDRAYALAVAASGVVTLAGSTQSSGFPKSGNAYDPTHNGGSAPGDAFVSRLDPSKVGPAQLVYSTFLGGDGLDEARALSVNATGVVTVAGFTGSTTTRKFPTTTGAYSGTYNGGTTDVFVSRLDPSKVSSAQLVYSTFLGHTGNERAFAVVVDANGVATLAGDSSSTKFPTTSGVYGATHAGGLDAFVSRLDPSKSGAAQLVYSTFLGGTYSDLAYALSVNSSGVMTVVGWTGSAKFPTTSNAYSTSHARGLDAFVSRLDPRKTGSGQLVYSTFLGGGLNDLAYALAVDPGGVVTVAGYTGSAASPKFPTTSGAYDTIYNGGPADAFVSRLDPSKTGSAQLVYSTYLGGSDGDQAYAVSVDPSGAAIVAGTTSSTAFPTSSGAYNTTHNGKTASGGDVFVSRLDMGVALCGDVHEIPVKTGGTQQLTVNAGKAHANRLYWIFGSITGTKGIDLLGVHIPLDPDVYTDIAITAVNGKEFKNFKGTLDANGLAAASFNVPANLPPPPPGLTVYHAYVVYDTTVRFFMASNAVPVRLK